MQHYCTANDQKLLTLVKSLKWFEYYFEGSTAETTSDNQVLEHFLHKLKLSRKQVRLLETLRNFGCFPFTLEPAEIPNLDDAVSRIRAVGSVVNNGEIPYIKISQFISGNRGNQFFEQVVNSLNVDQQMQNRGSNCKYCLVSSHWKMMTSLQWKAMCPCIHASIILHTVQYWS